MHTDTNINAAKSKAIIFATVQSDNTVLLSVWEGTPGDGQWLHLTLTPNQAIKMGQDLVTAGVLAKANQYDAQLAASIVAEQAEIKPKEQDPTPAILKTVGVSLADDECAAPPRRVANQTPDTTGEGRMIQLWQHKESGEVWAVMVGEDGTIINANRPLHHTEFVREHEQDFKVLDTRYLQEGASE